MNPMMARSASPVFRLVNMVRLLPYALLADSFGDVIGRQQEDQPHHRLEQAHSRRLGEVPRSDTDPVYIGTDNIRVFADQRVPQYIRPVESDRHHPADLQDQQYNNRRL